MKIPYLICLLFAISVSCSSASADSATSLEELKSTYEVASCIGCHIENGHQWSESPHAQSLSDPLILKSFYSFIFEKRAGTRRAARTDVLAECLTCHAPMAADASSYLLEHIAELIATAAVSTDEYERNSIRKKLSDLDVNCRVCHMIKGMPHDEVKPHTIYGTGWDEDEISHKSEYGFDTVGSDYLMSSELCMSCHRGDESGNSESPLLKFQPTAMKHYTDTKDEGTCQDCHMRGNGTPSHTFQR